MAKNFKKTFGSGDNKIELSTITIPVIEQIKLKFRLLKMFADVSSTLASTLMLGRENTSAKEEAEAVMNLIGSIKTIDGDEVVDVLVELCEYCDEVGQGKGKVYFDQVLHDKPMLMIYEIAIWVLKVNYADFIKGSGLLTALSKAQQKISGQLS